MMSPHKHILNEKKVTFHLGKVYRGFNDVSLCDETIFNPNETYLVMNLDNGKKFGFICEKTS